MSLKTKIMGGYLTLVLIITAVGVWSVFNLIHLNNVITANAQKNYRSIQAADNMLAALERQDSAELLFLVGEDQRGKEIFEDSRVDFQSWFATEESNITEPGEESLVHSIKLDYQEYLSLFNKLVQSASAVDAKLLYLGQVEPKFKQVRMDLRKLAELNNEAVVKRSASADAATRGAVVSTIGVALLATLVGLLLGWRLTTNIVRPTLHLTEKVREVGDGDWHGEIPVETRDEIGQLATEFNNMINRLRTYEETTLGKLIKERRKSETIVKMISDGVLVLDSQFNLLLINPAAERIFQIPEEAGLQKHFLAAINRRDVFAHLEQVMNLFKGSTIKDEIRLPEELARKTFIFNTQSKTLYYQMVTTPLAGPGGNISGLVVIFNDITFFKELDKHKTEFLSMVSHELRTPLTTMTMGLNLLKENLKIDTESREGEMLGAVEEETSRLTRLVNQLLELTRLQTGGNKLVLQQVDPEEIFKNTVEMFSVMAEKQNVRLTYKCEPGLPQVTVDKDKITSVMSNLIGNALRYTPAGGEIQISVVHSGKNLLFSVKDSGPGIPQEFSESIFKKFFQIKGRPGGGAGLGLAITKEIIQAHGGSIWVESEEGKGTTFFFSLPLEIEHKKENDTVRGSQ